MSCCAGGISSSSTGAYDGVVGDLDVAEIARDVHVLSHRAADDGDLPADGDAHVDRLLHAVDVRGERRDHDPPGERRDDLPERLADDALRLGEAGALCIGRVAEQKVDAAVSELGELADVGAEPVDRRVVELPVSGVEHTAGGGLEADPHGVRDRMRHAHELEAKRPELQRLALGVDLAQLGSAQKPVLVELRLHEAERQPCRPHLEHAHLAHEIRKRADVILVRVRQDDGTNRAVVEVAEVRQDQVDAEMLVAREREPGVDDDHLAGDLEHGHVLADLAEAPERDDPQDVVCHRAKHTDAAGGCSPSDGDEQAEPLEATAHAARPRRPSRRPAAVDDRRPGGPAGSAPPSPQSGSSRSRAGRTRGGARGRSRAHASTSPSRAART